MDFGAVRDWSTPGTGPTAGAIPTAAPEPITQVTMTTVFSALSIDALADQEFRTNFLSCACARARAS